MATSFGSTVGHDLGIVQRTILMNALTLAIETGLTLVEVPRLLQDRTLLRDTLSRSHNEDVKAYFAERFTRERSGSLVSLLARLEEITLNPLLAPMLAAKGMTRFDRLLEHAVTVVDLGGAPAGMSEIAKFFGQLILRKVVRAIWSRRVTRSSPCVTIFADEFQELVGPDMVSDTARLLTLARSQRVFFWTLFQQLAQVAHLSPYLLSVLATNTTFQLQFRTTVDDASRLAHILPVTGRVRRGGDGVADIRERPDYLSETEERRQLVHAVENMPRRLAWFLNRNRTAPAVLLKSATLDLEGATRRAFSLPKDIRAHVARGVLVRSGPSRPRLAATQPQTQAEAVEFPPGMVAPHDPDVSAADPSQEAGPTPTAPESEEAPTPAADPSAGTSPDAPPKPRTRPGRSRRSALG